MKIKKIAIIGLGYVGLPLAVELSKYYKVLGFDINANRIKKLNSGLDHTNEVSSKNLKKAIKNGLEITNNKLNLSNYNIFIVTVPTPVTKSNKPDFKPLLNACKILGKKIKRGTVIAFESTVYPGATQDICGKEIEKYSGLQMEKDFFLGYSPERINPGDKIHTIDKITKVVSAENKYAVNALKEVYSNLTSGNIFIAKNIKVAEASKVIENAQRDINIAFINEVAKISQKLGISVYDVLDASLTKWNFLNFYPGLVGGHCIGVDPFYLATKAKELGIDPKVILSGRKTNDSMGIFVARQINKKIQPKSKILILGITFKENVPDIRNSKIFDLVNFFKEKKHDVKVCDPYVSSNDVKKLKLVSIDNLFTHSYDLILLAVSHKEFSDFSQNKVKSLLNKNGLVADIKGLWRKKNTFDRYWSL